MNEVQLVWAKSANAAAALQPERVEQLDAETFREALIVDAIDIRQLFPRHVPGAGLGTALNAKFGSISSQLK